MEVSLEEIPDEGLLVSWAFTDRPELSLTVLPKLPSREVRRGAGREETELAMEQSTGSTSSPLHREMRNKQNFQQLRN